MGALLVAGVPGEKVNSEEEKERTWRNREKIRVEKLKVLVCVQSPNWRVISWAIFLSSLFVHIRNLCHESPINMTSNFQGLTLTKQEFAVTREWWEKNWLTCVFVWESLLDSEVAGSRQNPSRYRGADSEAAGVPSDPSKVAWSTHFQA
jgi:hypothetical protein